MDAVLVLDEEFPAGGAVIARIVVWELPRRLPGSNHNYKYSLSLVDGRTHVLRYDNEAGKGDHRHIGRREFAYWFTTLDQLQDDFWKDVVEWQKSKSAS